MGLTIERKGILDFVKLAKRISEYQFIWSGEANQVLIKRILKEEAADLTENGYRVARERAIEKTGAQLREIYEGCMKKASRAELKTDAIKIGVREN